MSLHKFSFQFHIGAIRSQKFLCAERFFPEFQFHIGAIRRRLDFGWKVPVLLKSKS